MDKKTAGLIFLGVCIVLAILLLTHTISSMQSGIAFAIALVALGLLSRGFTKSQQTVQKS